MEHILKLQPKYFDYINKGTIGLLRYNSFEELFNDFSIDIMADSSMTKKELLDVLSEFYTKEKQKQYGVIGIRIEKI